MRMNKLISISLCLMLLPLAAFAQTSVGSRCDTLSTVGDSQVVTLSQAVPVGDWLLVSIADNNTAAELSGVTDMSGNSYEAEFATPMAAGSGDAAVYATKVKTGLNAGGTVTVTFSTAGSSSTQSCVQVSDFTGVVIANDIDQFGFNDNTGSTMTVATSVAPASGNELVFSLFASSRSPGTISSVPPAVSIDEVCSSDMTLCLMPATNPGASTPAVETASAISAGSGAWGALILTFPSNDRIFADGFE